MRNYETIADPSAVRAGSKPAPTSPGKIAGLSPHAISRHLPPSSVGEVLPGLWVGNLMSVSDLADLVQKSTRDARSNKLNNGAVVTVISVLSNKNMIRFAVDALEQQRLQHPIKDTNASLNNCRGYPSSMDIKHVIIPLKDTVTSDLLSVLPIALMAIDDALDNTKKTSHGDDATTNPTSHARANDKPITPNDRQSALRNDDDDNIHRICLVHCAKGASRSVSVLIAYLLSRQSHRFKTFAEALAHVRSVQTQAMPNIGFALSLRRFERELTRKI